MDYWRYKSPKNNDASPCLVNSSLRPKADLKI